MKILRQIFFSIFFVLALTLSAYATKITVASTTVSNTWTFGGTTASLRIYSSQTFVASTSETIPQGTTGAWYKNVSCTVAGASVNCNSVILDSTVDGTPNDSKFVADLYDENGRLRMRYLSPFIVPTSLGTSVTWEQLRVYNSATIPLVPLDYSYYTAIETNVLVASKKADSMATNRILGRTTAGTGAIEEISTGANLTLSGGDLNVTATTNNRILGRTTAGAGNVEQLTLGNYLSFAGTAINVALPGGVDLALTYGNNLSTAVTAIGATPTVLNISTDVTVPSSLTVPSNILLNFIGPGKISVASGQVLTIGNLAPQGTRQLFTGAGRARIAARGSQKINLAWWSGTDTSFDVTADINDALLSLSDSGGGVLEVPCGIWRTTGGHTVSPNSVTIEGCGSDPDGLRATVFLLTNVGAANVFNLSNSIRNAQMRDFAIDLGTATAASGIYFTGTYPNTAVGFTASNISVDASTAGASSVGINLDSTDATWDQEHFVFEKLRVITAVNGIGVRINTHNSNIQLMQPWFYLSNGSTAVKLIASADLRIEQPSFLGVTSPPPAAVETLERIISQASITTGTTTLTLNAATPLNDTFDQHDIGQKVVIAGKLDSYITSITDSFTATVAANATGTAANEAMSVYRASMGVAQAYAGVWVTGDYTNIEIANSQDEGVRYFLINEIASPNSGVIKISNSYVQSLIQLNGHAVITSVGNHYFSNTVEDAALVTGVFHSYGDRVERKTLHYANAAGERTLAVEKLFGPMLGVTRFVNPGTSNIATTESYSEMPMRIWHQYRTWYPNPRPTEPVLSLGTGSDKPLLVLGQLSQQTGLMLNTYTFKRNVTTGYLDLTGSQTGFIALQMNMPVIATSINLGGATLQDILSATASLDFTALAASSCEDLTITVTGAADGDAVSVGAPNALASIAGTSFSGFVSAANTVKVRRCNSTTAVTADPAAATVRVTVSQF